MEKTQHNNEIISTRKGGFGGSDAPLFLRIAANGLDSLSATDNRRIAVMMGLAEPAQFTNAAMEAGHAFEDYYQIHEIAATGALYDREVYVEDKELAKNFKIFCHADYATAGFARVKELKYSQEDTEAVIKRYNAQCQWYYMLGAEHVDLVHGQGLVEPFIPQGITEVWVPADAYYIERLNTGISILDEAISNGWRPELAQSETYEDLPANVQKALVDVSTLSLRIKELTTELDAAKAIISAYMGDVSITSITSELGSVSYTAESKTLTLDTKKLQAEQAEIARQYMKETTKKAFITYRPAKQK